MSDIHEQLKRVADALESMTRQSGVSMRVTFRISRDEQIDARLVSELRRGLRALFDDATQTSTTWSGQRRVRLHALRQRVKTKTKIDLDGRSIARSLRDAGLKIETTGGVTYVVDDSKARVFMTAGARAPVK